MNTIAAMSRSTKAFAPCVIETYIAIDSELKARSLEKYFKTGSGKAILKKRILMLTEMPDIKNEIDES